MTKAPLYERPLSLETVQQAIHDTLSSFFASQRTAAAQIDEKYHTLWQSIETLGLAGGKRIRPYLILLTYQGLSDKPIEDILPIATSQELLHLAMLIHDDIVDRDTIRYGVPNIAGQYDPIYKPLIAEKNERQHFADGSALLAGDLLISSAYSLVNESNLPPEKKLIAQAILTDAIFNVTAGQLLDTEAVFRPFTDSDARKISLYKTATYSFIGPLTIAARLADASDATVKHFTQFGEYLGIAYQFTDDLLGVFGNEAVTGKSASGDLREGKHTYLAEQFYELATADQRVAFDALFGKGELSTADAQTLRTLLEASGAKQHTIQLTSDYAQRAREILEDIPINPPHKQVLDKLVDKCTNRQF